MTINYDILVDARERCVIYTQVTRRRDPAQKDNGNSLTNTVGWRLSFSRISPNKVI